MTLAAAVGLGAAVAATSCAPAADGAVVFEDHCASCHLDPLYPRAPPIDMLQEWSVDLVLMTLETGLMAEQGQALTSDERRAVADFISLGQ